jgi:1-acyl-sn-glycerol-3-phosphate acyltransferase
MQSGDPLLPHLPRQMPRTGGGRIPRWIGRTVLRLAGWKVVGPIPPLARAVVIVAPHSSNWDGILGMAAKLAMGVDIRVLGKAQLFWWPLGPLLRRLGAIPVDRSRPQGVVDQAIALIGSSERIWFVVAPEGTRTAVKEWKRGFWKIAHGAGVPVIPAYFHYPQRTIGFGPAFELGQDMEADMARIRQWYRPWMGKHHGTD